MANRPTSTVLDADLFEVVGDDAPMSDAAIDAIAMLLVELVEKDENQEGSP